MTILTTMIESRLLVDRLAVLPCAGKPWKLSAVKRLAHPSASIRLGAHAEFGPAWIAVLPEVG